MIDMTLVWHCRRCRQPMLHRGDMLVCPDGCGSVLPTDSDEHVHQTVLSPVELCDELSEMASRAVYVDRIAAQVGARADAPPDHA